MRIFWAIIAVLILATGALFLTDGEPRPEAPVTEPATTGAESPATDADRSVRLTPPIETDEETQVGLVIDPVVRQAPAEVDPGAAEPVRQGIDETVAAAEPAYESVVAEIEVPDNNRLAMDQLLGELPYLEPSLETAPATPGASEAEVAALSDPEALRDEAITDTEGTFDVASAGSQGDGGEAAGDSDPDPAPAEEIAALVVNDDGSLVIDGKMAIEGDGSAESPYRLPWNLLISASATYEPRLGRDELPEWVGHLEGKTVEISGFLMMPAMGQPTKDLLAMKNMWDGCCIGIPPSPYDAVEVTLAEEVDPFNTTHAAAGYGTIRGKFKADPYVVLNGSTSSARVTSTASY
ncbi:MAG: hypothetical protein AAFU70_07080, partial [Planctomycetota bacterium]